MIGILIIAIFTLAFSQQIDSLQSPVFSNYTTLLPTIDTQKCTAPVISDAIIFFCQNNENFVYNTHELLMKGPATAKNYI